MRKIQRTKWQVLESSIADDLLNTSEGSHRGSDWKTLSAWAITMLITNPQVNVYNLADETLQHKELVQQFDGS